SYKRKCICRMAGSPPRRAKPFVPRNLFSESKAGMLQKLDRQCWLLLGCCLLLSAAAAGIVGFAVWSVLVHTGDAADGQYHALVRPDLTGQWYKFDSEKVVKVEQCVGEEEYSSAYILVYIRRSDREKILCSVDEKNVAEHVRVRWELEQEEKEQKRKQQAEAHVLTVKVSRDEDMREQIGRNMYFDLVDHDRVRSFRVQNETTFAEFKGKVEKELGTAVAGQQFWLWVKRLNDTYRPHRLLSAEEERMTVGQLRDSVNGTLNTMHLHLFLEGTSSTIPSSPLASSLVRAKNDILIFLKLYDPVLKTIRYMGHLFVSLDNRPQDVQERIKKMCGLASSQDIQLFEEVKFHPHVMCELVGKTATFRASELMDGDILCVQRALSPEEKAGLLCPDVPSFLQHVSTQQLVRFRQLDAPKEDSLCLLLSKQDTYDDVVRELAEKLGVSDPARIRLTAHNCYLQRPKQSPVKFRGVDCLADLLAFHDQTTDILYYETLNIPLPKAERLKSLGVVFSNKRARRELGNSCGPGAEENVNFVGGSS
ncbi:unnamed protein product, partial [Closterium sp. Naga37s-1]